MVGNYLRAEAGSGLVFETGRIVEDFFPGLKGLKRLLLVERLYDEAGVDEDPGAGSYCALLHEIYYRLPLDSSEVYDGGPAIYRLDLPRDSEAHIRGGSEGAAYNPCESGLCKVFIGYNGLSNIIG